MLGSLDFQVHDLSASSASSVDLSASGQRNISLTKQNLSESADVEAVVPGVSKFTSPMATDENLSQVSSLATALRVRDDGDEAPAYAFSNNSPLLHHRQTFLNASASLRFNWCDEAKTLIITPREGFGNRMRAVIAAHYLAFITRRQLNIFWPEFADWMHLNASPHCVKWIISPPTGTCRLVDCAVKTWECVNLFTTRPLQEILPDDDSCLHLISFSPWDRILLDNAANHGALLSITQKIPVSAVLESVTRGLKSEIWQTHKKYRDQMVKSAGAKHALLSVHIRTGADKEDGGLLKHLFMPQLRCAALLQDHFMRINVTSAIFLESDSTKVKSVAAEMDLKNLVMLEKHAERKDLKHTLVLWMLLGEADVFLGAHTSSLSKTASQRTGTVLYQLPNQGRFKSSTPDGERTLECRNSEIPSTKTHDAVYVLTPSECAAVYPECPQMSVDVVTTF